MARRSNTISLNLEGQKAIHSVDTFEQALHLFLRDDCILPVLKRYVTAGQSAHRFDALLAQQHLLAYNVKIANPKGPFRKPEPKSATCIGSVGCATS
ncbi:hypothetical protein [Ectobacillus sp. sgz5001026]|uniref:hypothetical protein n=1 Tax=Ectobacillus sp. sgz5001026 TaxID=3242473 RepID=UPI0036D3CB8F